MADSTNKKALVRRYQRETLAGWIKPSSFLQPEGIELMSQQGEIRLLPYPEVKAVCFVRDWDAGTGERHEFLTRPKMAGLWVHARFRDGETMEGILPNNLMGLDPAGFSLIPPDPFANTQRIFVPRSALVGIEVLGVIGSPLRKRKQKAAPEAQGGLFDQPAEP
ncbi:MAG: hypothetical protein JST11_00760 [Acidobacteria bacterium]|nr:hypothetical protein [Acidobacteriota bacterium]